MKPLKSEDIRLISSGQVITGVIDCIKELIENSLDAGAKSIKIKLIESGLNTISVIDDGCGIPVDGRNTVAHAYTTSKIRSIQDLTHDLSTFGFRGEALHAICIQSKLTIITRTRSETTGQKLIFSNDGTVIKVENITANYGTTVIVSDLMSCFPVRRLSESSRITKDILNSFFVRYFLACPSIRFSIEADPLYTVIRPPMPSLTAAYSREFGQKITASLSEREIEAFSGDVKIKITALLPSPTAEWHVSSTSQKSTNSNLNLSSTQIILINGRPVKNDEIINKINKFYQAKFGGVPRRYPRFVISIDFFRETSLCSSLFEVNLDASKSKALFVDSTKILKLIDKVMNSEQKLEETSKKQSLTSYPKDIKFCPFVQEYHFDNESECNEMKRKMQVKLQQLRGIKWYDVGKVGGFTVFHVTNDFDSDYIVFANTNGLFEKIGVPSSEIGRMSLSELMMLYYDQVLEENEEKQCLFFAGTIH